MALRFLGFSCTSTITLAASVAMAVAAAGVTASLACAVAVTIEALTEFNPSAWITCNIATSYYNPFTAKDAIWHPGVITHPEINLLIRFKFYYAFCHPVHY